MSEIHGGFTCEQAELGAQHMAGAIVRLRDQRNAFRRAYDAEVIGRRDEVTRLHAELGKLRAELGAVVLACDAIPDITISKWACGLGPIWNPVREALRARRKAQGFDVDAPDPETAFDEHGWLRARRPLPLALVEDRTPEQLAADGDG